MAISDELRKRVDPNNECCCEHCLSSKCKEWACKDDNFRIDSNTYSATVNYNFRTERDIDNYDYYTNSTKYFNASTEPEAVFQACQWILDNKDN